MTGVSQRVPGILGAAIGVRDSILAGNFVLQTCHPTPFVRRAVQHSVAPKAEEKKRPGAGKRQECV